MLSEDTKFMVIGHGRHKRLTYCALDVWQEKMRELKKKKKHRKVIIRCPNSKPLENSELRIYNLGVPTVAQLDGWCL